MHPRFAQREKGEPCGTRHGISGHARLAEAITDLRHPDHEELLDWVGGSYDPEEFDPAKVEFDDPKVR